MTISALRTKNVFDVVASLNFANLPLRVALTADFASSASVLDDAELADPSPIGLQELCRE